MKRYLIVAVLAGSAVLAGCSSTPQGAAYSTTDQWCTKYQAMLMENKLVIEETFAGSKKFSASDADRLDKVHEQEIGLVQGARDIGALPQNVIDDRVALDSKVIAPRLGEITEAIRDGGPLALAIAGRNYEKLLDELEIASQELGYSDSEDAVNEFSDAIMATCQFDPRDIVGDDPAV